MLIREQTFFVFGLSRSGLSVARYLHSEGATVYAYDDVEVGAAGENKKTLAALGVQIVQKENLAKMAEVCDAIVLSPGVPIDHPLALSFRRNKKGVLGESEIAARVLSNLFVAVTGTNGKTTTVSMITELLQKAGIKARACGNIGVPMIDLAKECDDCVGVAEISSFQLETLNSFRPHIAVFLNIAEDHLNRHYNMENYRFLKGKLLKNLTEMEYAVLNYDDALVREFAEKIKAKVVYFSLKEEVDGAYFANGNLCYEGKVITSAKKLLLGGMHNVQNALATICVGKLMGLSDEVIACAVEGFKGVKHRIEEVEVVDGVRYIDDSKATNVDAAITAIKCMAQDTILLLGGKNKSQNYDELFETIKNSKVKHTIVYGENRFELIKSAMKGGWDAVSLCTGFECAVRLANMQAKSGQTILLSPASASFDEFAGYEERGGKFVELVQEFKEESGAIADGETVEDEKEQRLETHIDRGEEAEE